jgi:phosphoglycolate phosphatase
MNELHGELPPLTSCWMIGDRHHDIDAGAEVGTHSAGVLWGFGSREELSSAGATAIAETPQELVAILKN